MTIGEFFSWLAVTDLSQGDPEVTREILGEVLANLPEGKRYDPLADCLEGFVEDPQFAPQQLAKFPQLFAHLLPKPQSALDVVEDELDQIALELDPDACETDRLVRFERILKGLDSDPDELSRRRLQNQLSSLEGEFRAVWEDYLKTRVTPSEVTAESVGGHRFLEDGFTMWFQACTQAGSLELDEAWESACEGNRLFMAVSNWSDQLRDENTAEIAHG